MSMDDCDAMEMIDKLNEEHDKLNEEFDKLVNENNKLKIILIYTISNLTSFNKFVIDRKL
jgi:hypothetical protein